MKFFDEAIEIEIEKKILFLIENNYENTKNS